MSKERELKEIVIKKNSSISFPNADEINGDILIIGSYNGICGEVKWNGNGLCEIAEDFYGMNSDVFVNNMNALLYTIRNGNKIVIASSKDTILYFKNLLYAAAETFIYDKSRKEIKKMFNKCVWPIDITELYEDTYIKYNVGSHRRNEIAQKHIDDIVTNKIFENIKNMKFDVVIQNPPYNGSLHLDFFNKGLDVLTETGKMVIIEPATWLINVRKNGRAKRYDAIKQRIDGHIESVIIENLNKEFNTTMYVPFAITTIDMSKTFDTIDFTCCGETRKVKSIYDCNLVGEYATIWSILEKVQSFGNMMKAHITDKRIEKDTYYIGFQKDCQTVLCQMETERVGMNYETSDIWYKTLNGEIETRYISSMLHRFSEEISKTPYCKLDKDKKLTENMGWNVYGDETELQNWKYFVLNNKLPLFLSFCFIYDMHLNNLDDFLPWLVDKQYTDDEINKLFGFTDEEIKLIDTTIKKYERNSPWFKRYMCGKDAVSDEEVNNFIAEISK